MLTARKRILLLALIALAVPFPALAIDGDDGSGAAASLSVSASLAGCGLAQSQVLCQIDAGWNAIPGADSYQVSVIGADGSVTDQGSTSGLGTSVWVVYGGPGTYTVQVTAWGTPPGETEPEVIAREKAAPEAVSKGKATARPDADGPQAGDEAPVAAEAPPLTDDPAAAEDAVCGEEDPEQQEAAAPAVAGKANPAPAPATESAATEPAEQTEPTEPICP